MYVNAAWRIHVRIRHGAYTCTYTPRGVYMYVNATGRIHVRIRRGVYTFTYTPRGVYMYVYAAGRIHVRTRRGAYTFTYAPSANLFNLIHKTNLSQKLTTQTNVDSRKKYRRKLPIRACELVSYLCRRSARGPRGKSRRRGSCPRCNPLPHGLRPQVLANGNFYLYFYPSISTNLLIFFSLSLSFYRSLFG